jgi:hypothetical protein
MVLVSRYQRKSTLKSIIASIIERAGWGTDPQRAQRLFSEQALHPVAEDYYLLIKDYFDRIYLFEKDK